MAEGGSWVCQEDRPLRAANWGGFQQRRAEVEASTNNPDHLLHLRISNKHKGR
jgi:hypothetical protein